MTSLTSFSSFFSTFLAAKYWPLWWGGHNPPPGPAPGHEEPRPQPQRAGGHRHSQLHHQAGPHPHQRILPDDHQVNILFNYNLMSSSSPNNITLFDWASTIKLTLSIHALHATIYDNSRGTSVLRWFREDAGQEEHFKQLMFRVEKIFEKILNIYLINIMIIGSFVGHVWTQHLQHRVQSQEI